MKKKVCTSTYAFDMAVWTAEDRLTAALALEKVLSPPWHAGKLVAEAKEALRKARSERRARVDQLEREGRKPCREGMVYGISS